MNRSIIYIPMKSRNKLIQKVNGNENNNENRFKKFIFLSRPIRTSLLCNFMVSLQPVHLHIIYKRYIRGFTIGTMTVSGERWNCRILKLNAFSMQNCDKSSPIKRSNIFQRHDSIEFDSRQIVFCWSKAVQLFEIFRNVSKTRLFRNSRSRCISIDANYIRKYLSFRQVSYSPPSPFGNFTTRTAMIELKNWDATTIPHKNLEF